MATGEHIDLEEFGWAVMNLNESTTGIPLTIYISGKEPYHDSYGPRIRVSNGKEYNPYEMVPIRISKSPNISEVSGIEFSKLSLVCRFIVKNYDVLMKHWEDQHHFSSFETAGEIVKV